MKKWLQQERIMSNLNQTIESAIGAISVLLVFVTVLFSIRYPEINKVIEEELEIRKPKALKSQKEKIIKTIIFKWLPVVLLNLIVVYVTTPLAVKIIKHSSFAIFNFDFLRTSFILIWSCNIMFFLYSVFLLVMLVRKTITKKESNK
jgi:hypothetical protein